MITNSLSPEDHPSVLLDLITSAKYVYVVFIVRVPSRSISYSDDVLGFVKLPKFVQFESSLLPNIVHVLMTAKESMVLMSWSILNFLG